ncbi:MAG: FISUMP domain-containing protein, partial [Ignavibacteriaceae bacterium]
MKIRYRRFYLGYHLIVLFILLLSSNFAQENNQLFQVLSETVTDFDGNVYKTVKIGEQVWMLENLKVTHYRNGTPIRNILDDDNKWSSATDGAYCMAENDSVEYKKIFGILYNYYAVVNKNKLSPEG